MFITANIRIFANITKKIMKIFKNNFREFIEDIIRLCSSLMGEEKRLRPRERDFLIECCIYNYKGGDLNDFASLKKYMLDKKMFTRGSDTSIYKYKMSIRGWAKTGRDYFIIPHYLDYKEGDKLNEFNISVVYDSGQDPEGGI